MKLKLHARICAYGPNIAGYQKGMGVSMNKIAKILTGAFMLSALLCSACQAGTDTPDTVGTDTTVANTTNEGQAVRAATDGVAYMAVPLKALYKQIYDEAVHENYLYYICVEDEKPLLVQIDLHDPDTPVILPLDIPAEQTSQQVAVDANGGLHILTIAWGENWEFYDMFWHRLDADGAVIESTTLPAEIGEGMAQLVLDFAVDVRGNAYIGMFYDFARDDVYELFVMDPAGAVLLQTPMLGFNFFFQNDAGDVLVHHYPTLDAIHGRGQQTYVADLIDPVQGELRRYADLTAYSFEKAWLGMHAYADGTMFVANTDGVYDYVIADDVMLERFLWAELRSRFSGAADTVYPLNSSDPGTDGWMLVATRGSGGGDVGYPQDVAYKIVRPQGDADMVAAEASAAAWEELVAGGGVGDVTIGVVGWSGTVLDAALDAFHQDNPHVTVSVKQYGSPYGDDHSEGLLALNMDIISGNSPDLLLMHQGLSYGAYGAAGLLMDLYPFLAADADFDMADYRENIIRAYEMGGKLYGIPLSFSIETLYGKAADLGGMEQWDFDEFVAFCERFPDSLIFQRPTQEAVLDICLMANGDGLVDWESVGDGFDRELVEKILEFSGRFIAADRYADERMIMERVNAGDIHLMRGAAGPSTQFEMEIFGGPISHIGFPSENSNGYLIYSQALIAISSKCEHMGTAWDFISFLLSEEMQESDAFYYPIRKDALEPIIKRAKEPGGYFGASGDGLDLSYEIRGASDAEIGLFLDIIEKADTIRIFDQQIDAIIKEEAGAYFSGQRGLVDTVDIIANRVGIYVKETK